MAKSALLVMDVQNVVVSQFPDSEYLPRLRTAVDAARAAGLPVIYPVVGVRSGPLGASGRNKIFGALAQSGGLPAGSDLLQIHPAVAPEPGDTVVTKTRVSAFSGSDLELVLRAGDIDHLVLTGIATSGIVLSTLRQAADLDYGLTVLADGCLDSDPEVHRVLTEKVFPMQAEVRTVADWTPAP
ncbi:cysteine hydrolase [Actinomadura craniellae]|uniref:Cysteine hydrolase n=1 Tax=Actinomadura craniellae TaxID=2231787 RepID=A0A365H1E3_9ACTN|nr:cysteine hydrolase [Actinomadura craniellae]RAY12859.1 cysteine hydrolase [Actinomadura craniellae]